MQKALIVGENSLIFEGNNLKILNECLYKADLEDYTFIPLAKFKPSKHNLIIALGDVVLEALTEEKGIYKWRGSTLTSSSNQKIIPVFSPATIQKQWRFIHVLTHDLVKCKENLAFPEIKKKERTYIINPSFDEAMAELERLQKKEYLSLDLETYKMSEILRCIGLGSSDDRAICIPFINKLTKVWKEKEEKILWTEISKLLMNPEIKKIAQNAQFEMTQLHPFVKDKMIMWSDPMRQHALLYPEYPHSLGFLTSIYTDMNYYKDEGKFSPTENYDFDKLQIYNCKDVVATLEVSLKLRKELKDKDLWEFYCLYDNPLMHSLWKMQMKGVRVNIEKMRFLKKKTQREIEGYNKELNEKIGYELNVNSPKQMTKFLYEDLKLPKKYKRGTKNLTTDKDALKDLISKHPDRSELQLILEIRSREKILSTFLEMKLRNGRVNTEYGVTKSGRLSSSQDIFGIGANMQNIPKFLRDIFIPDEGKTFIIADLSQAEARVVAWLAKDENLKSVFLEGGDVHTKMASLVFNIPESKVNKKQRSLAKKLRHAKNYGQSVNAFSKDAGILLKEARIIFNVDDKLFPNVKGIFHETIKQDLTRTRTLHTPHGWKRTFLQRWGNNLFDEAYSFKPQNAVAIYINQGLLRLDYALPEECEARIQIHDEIVVECPIGIEEECIKIIKHSVEKELYIEGDFLKIPLDIAIGINWKDGVEV